MSRVNVDAAAFSDARFALVADDLGWDDPDFVIGKMTRVWWECTNRERVTLSARTVTRIFGHDGAVDALVAHELADDLGDGDLRIRGCKGRTDWLAKKRKSGRVHGKKGGRPRKGDPLRVGNGDRSRKITPPAPAPAPAPATAPAPEHSSPSGDISTRGRAHVAGSVPGPAAQCDPVFAVESLWSKLQAAQREVGLDPTGRTPGDEVRTLGAIREFGAETLERYLRVLVRKAQENPAERKWLDGVKTWNHRVIDANRGESPEPTPAAKPRKRRGAGLTVEEIYHMDFERFVPPTGGQS